MSDGNDFDILLTAIGFGRWQIPVIMSTAIIAFQWPVQMIGSTLLSAPLDFRCFNNPPTSSVDNMTYNVSYLDTGPDYFDNKCLPNPVSSSVDIPVQVDSPVGQHKWTFTGLPSCPYVEYDTSMFTGTVYSQWHLICERSNLRPLFQMMSNIGGMTGSILSGHIGDKFGRHRAIAIGCIGNLIAVGIMAFVPSYTVVLAMRVAVGIMNMTALLSLWNLALESTPSRHRSLVMMLLGLPYSIGVMTLALYGYFIRTWQYLLLVAASPSILLIPLSVFIDESSNWLIQKGNAEKAKNILEKAAKRNKAQLTTSVATVVDKLVESSSSPRTENTNREEKSESSLVTQAKEIMRYFRSSAMRKIFLLTPILWFLQSCLYLSVGINAHNFTRSDTGPFLYLALVGAMDGTAILISTPLATRVGRKIVIGTGMFLGAVLFLLALPVPDEQYWAKWVLVMAGFLSVGGTFQLNYIYGPELFPTEIRSRGFAFVNVMGNLGFICSPLVTEILAKYTWWAANAFFGFAGIVGSLTIPLLPETRNKPLPETLQDIEERDRKGKSKTEEKEAINENYNEETV